MVVGRFAPSPSGRMHLGNVFSALLAWLSARSAGGELLLRIEDLDPDRCRPEYAAQLRDDLRWLGLSWDREGPAQSTRGTAYAEAFRQLEARGLVYPCYCTRAELHAASAPHASDGTPVYPGTCRGLTAAERAAKTRAPAWRLRVPEERIGFRDGLQGLYEEDLARDCGDFIVRRSDGVYAYQLAVTVDLSLIHISELPDRGGLEVRQDEQLPHASSPSGRSTRTGMWSRAGITFSRRSAVRKRSDVVFRQGWQPKYSCPTAERSMTS